MLPRLLFREKAPNRSLKTLGLGAFLLLDGGLGFLAGENIHIPSLVFREYLQANCQRQSGGIASEEKNESSPPR